MAKFTRFDARNKKKGRHKSQVIEGKLPKIKKCGSEKYVHTQPSRSRVS